MRIFNTLTREKDEFKPITEGEVKIYACGPTVYNYIHIGNARPLCVFDVLRRYFEWRGYKVSFVQNFTDIDDKLIKRANEESSTVPEIAERYIKEFWTDADGLNVKHATVNPRATENIEQIQSIISALVEKGYAYQSGGDVYYRAKKFSGYGKLSHQPLEDLEAGARIDVTEIKEDPDGFLPVEGRQTRASLIGIRLGARADPAGTLSARLWRAAISARQLIFTAAGLTLFSRTTKTKLRRAEAANGCEFAHYWMHNGFINVDNHKMSKSLGNFFTVRDVAEKYGYEPIRYMMVSCQYRSPINYSL